MPTPPNKPEDLQAALDLITKHGSASFAAQISGINRSTLNHRYNKALIAGMTSNEVPTGVAVHGTSTLYNDKGEVQLQWVKTKEDKAFQEEKLKSIAEEMKNDIPQIKPFKQPKEYDKNLMSITPMGDPHFGLYCWADEVGEDFNIDIAKEDFCGAVKYLVSQSPSSEKFIIANLGDFFHSDSNKGETTKGTRLDTDTRLAKVVRVGVSSIRTAIETALERHKTVEVINAIGNHDETLSLCLSILLSHVYENEPRVVVHDQPTRRHYITHGKVLIGVTHGDKTKEANLPGLMATERPKDWGNSKYRYWYRGHHHHDSKKEYNGATVEQFRTLAPNDEYSTSGGWLSGSDMKLLTHHKDYGEVSRVVCSINLLRDLSKGR